VAEPSSALVRRAVLERKPYRAGTTIDQARKRYGVERVVKLSSNENPLGTPPAALDALRRVERLNAYDDDDYPELRAAAARRYGAAPENVIAGHGSNELVWLAFSAFVDPGEAVVMGVPTFSLFPKYAHLQGAQVIEVPLRAGVHDLEAMLAAVGPRTKMVVLCDPNNPTGTAVRRSDFARFLEKIPPTVLVVIDQAYGEYMPPDDFVDGVAVALATPNVLVARTMSKIYGLASRSTSAARRSPRRSRLSATKASSSARSRSTTRVKPTCTVSMSDSGSSPIRRRRISSPSRSRSGPSARTRI
jgi:histidinol-phosphate aminotransferase